MENIERKAEIMGKQDYESDRRGSTFDQVKSTVADKLHSAARAIQQKVGRDDSPDANSNFAGFGQKAANWLDQSADYVGEMEPQRVRRDLENQVRQNPGRSLLIAGAVGLLLGGLLRRR